MTERGLSFWHPASLLATWFGSGLPPRVPGTWGIMTDDIAAAVYAGIVTFSLAYMIYP